MRGNSGDDEGRNRRVGPTVKEHELACGKSGAAVLDRKAGKAGTTGNSKQQTTSMGSNARKSGQKGD